MEFSVPTGFSDKAKAMMDYLMFKEGLDAPSFKKKLLEKVLYGSVVGEDGDDVVITIGKGDPLEG